MENLKRILIYFTSVFLFIPQVHANSSWYCLILTTDKTAYISDAFQLPKSADDYEVKRMSQLYMISHQKLRGLSNCLGADVSLQEMREEVDLISKGTEKQGYELTRSNPKGFTNIIAILKEGD